MPYASATTTASGSSAHVTVPFPFLDRSHVHVSVNGVQTVDNLLTWNSDSDIVLPSTPTAGATVTVRRSTPAGTLLITLQDQALYDPNQWNMMAEQLLYVMQEAYDAVGDVPAFLASMNTILAATNDLAAQALASKLAADADATGAAASLTSAQAVLATINAEIAGVITGTRIAITGDYPVQTTDGGKIISCRTGGVQAKVQFGDPTTYPTIFRAKVENNQTDASVDVYLNGTLTRRLLPGQKCVVEREGSSFDIPGQEERLRTVSGGLIVYVSCTGGDDVYNDGLQPARPFATNAAALLFLYKRVDCCRYQPTIQMITPGTYDPIFGSYPLVGCTEFTLRGDDSSLDAAATYVVQCAAGQTVIGNRDLSTLTILGLKVRTTGNGSTALSTTNGCNLDYGCIVFDTFPLGVLKSGGTGADFNCLAPCRYLGDFVIGGQMDTAGCLNMTSFTHEIPNVLNFTAFFTAVAGGIVNGGCLFSGAGAGTNSHGTKYITATAGGVRGITAGWIVPGDVGGSVTSPGWTD